jgi:DNA sulfur modification protein DndE
MPLAEAQTKDLAYYIEHAPFKMAMITTPVFPQKTFSISDYGAVGDGKTMNTEAIAKAINACTEAGGGTVLIPTGTWLTGPIELKSNVELHTAEGANINFTDNHSLFPTIKTGDKTKREIITSPIYGHDLKNIAITGKGVFDGAGESWRPVKKSKVSEVKWNLLIGSGGVLGDDGKVWWPDPKMKDHDKRPYMLYLVNCENVLLEDFTLKNSPKYLIYPNNCTNLLLNRVKVHNDWDAQNGDGIDISACKRVALYECTVNAGDDGICMKSSGTPNPNDSANLSEVVIAKCTVYRAHGGFVIGSNIDGGMKNIYVTDCNFIGSDIGVRIKSGIGKGGLVHDVYIDHITMKNIPNEGILFDTYYENKPAGYKESTKMEKSVDKIPDFRNIYFNHIKCDGAETAIFINGLPEQKIKQIYFENLDMKTNKGFICKNAEDITLKNVNINCKKPVYQTNKCKNINIINSNNQ